MAERTWERLGAATGLGFVALLVAGYFTVELPVPKPSDPLADIASYLTTNRAGLLAQQFLFAAGGALFLWFLGSVYSRLRQAEGSPARLSVVSFGGGVATIVLGYLSGVLMNAGTLRFAGQEVHTDLFFQSATAFNFIAFPAAVFVAAASLVIVRRGALEPWVGFSGLFLALAVFVAGTGLFVQTGALAQGDVYQVAVFFGFLLWVGILSILLVQRAGAAGAPAQKAAPRKTTRKTTRKR
jgi:hypothetical protein